MLANAPSIRPGSTHLQADAVGRRQALAGARIGVGGMGQKIGVQHEVLSEMVSGSENVPAVMSEWFTMQVGWTRLVALSVVH
jgi:hypothetical protein